MIEGVRERRFAMPRRLGGHWAMIAVGTALGIVALADLAATAAILLASAPPGDYRLYQSVVATLGAGGNLFAADPGYRWSPLAAYALIPVVAIGLPAWRALHLVALLALRDWRLILVVGLAWPFWKDVQLGSVFAFVFIAAVSAYRGSRIGMAAYFGLFLLMPRPLMVPLAIWLLWKQPAWRAPVVLAGLAEVGLLAAMGTLTPWCHELLASGGEELLNPTNVAPSAIIGVCWVIIGMPLAVWFTWRGRLGLASLAASPYWLWYYLLFGLLEFVTPTDPAPRLLPIALTSHTRPRGFANPHRPHRDIRHRVKMPSTLSR